MTKTTKEQRRAIKRIFDRGPISGSGYGMPLTYRQFRRRAFCTLGDDSCIMIPWAGMILGIERDGYIHS